MRIAIAGGTGTVGRHVVAAVSAAGDETVVLSRAAGIDLLAADGLPAALDGCDAVIDVCSTPSLNSAEAARFFGTETENLLAAERAAGVGHHVVLSIVGAAPVDDGHYAGKRVQEDLVRASGDSWSMLRTTQFHEFAAQMAARPRVAGLHLVPQMRSQPIAAAEVGRRLAELAAGAPVGLAPDLAGPREERMSALVRDYLRHAGKRAPVLAVPLPGPLGRAMRDGSLLPGAEAVLVGPTFAEWLAGL